MTAQPIVAEHLHGASAPPVSVTVVICAYTEDRWEDTLAALESVRHQSPAPVEVLVVIDHNASLFRRMRGHAAGFERVRVVENGSEPGLSGGKNTGALLASGEVVAFLDDDAVAEPGWIAGLAAAYVDPGVLGVGGLTLPAWETERPHWWPAEFDWVVGCTFVGRDPGEVRNLLGGNASFRRTVFATAGGFPVHIGRSARHARPLGCEETEFCIRAASRIPGGRFLFTADAVIHHRVPRARETFSYFRSRCYAEGLSKALVTESVGVGAGLAAERRYASVALRRGVLRGVRDGLTGDRAGALRAAAILAGLLTTVSGYAVGSARSRLRSTAAA